MSYDLWASLTPQDRRQATRASAGACLLAQALTRQYGGEWSVSGSSVTQTVGDEVTWEGKPTVSAQAIILRYDFTATGKTNRRVLVAKSRKHGAPKKVEDDPGCVKNTRWGQKPCLARNAGLAVTSAGGLFLIFDGLAWVLFAIMSLAAVALSGLFARAHMAHNQAKAEGSVAAQGKQMYAHVNEPAGQPAEAEAREEVPGYDDGMPAPLPAGPAEAPAFSEPAPVTRSEPLYRSADPEPITDPAPAAAPAPAAPASDPVPATAGGEAA